MKNLFTLSFLLLSVTVVHAQSKFLDSFNTNLLPDAKHVNDVERLDDENVLVRPLSTVNTSNRGGGPIWSEDFGGGFPEGWVSDDASGISPWKWSTNGSHGFFNSENGADYDPPISSTTGGNGFLINDPDSSNHFTYGQPSGTTYEYLESYFATTAIDLGMPYSSLLLQFEQSFRFNNNVDMEVQVSSDSTNWTTYTVQGGANNNSASDDPDFVSINISGAIGSSQTVYLRIGWSARVYFWMIDDMQIVQGADNDMSMTDVWHGDIINAWEYQKIPLSQATEVVVGAASLNLGGFAQPNTVYYYDISNEGGSVDSGTFAATNDSIVSTGADTTWFSTGFTPTETGTYTVTVEAYSDSADADSSNNVAQSVFEITDNIYAHDDEDNIVFQVNGGNNASDEANEYKIGMYYEAIADMNLTAVQVAFGNNTEATSCIVEVFNASDNLDDALETVVYDIDLGNDISPGATPNLVNILIDDGDGVLLEEGNVYLISIGNTGVGEELWILASDGDDDFGQLRYGPFGAGGAINWYTGYTTSPLVRINTDPRVDVVELATEEMGYGIYPNPSNDVLSLTINSEFGIKDLTIVDVTGKLVQTIAVQQNTETLRVDISNLTAGVYFVNATSNTGVVSQKLIVQ